MIITPNAHTESHKSIFIIDQLVCDKYYSKCWGHSREQKKHLYADKELVNLITMCLGVFRLGFILFGTLWVSWTWVIISFPILGSFQLLSPQVFSHGLSFCLLLLGPL